MPVYHGIGVCIACHSPQQAPAGIIPRCLSLCKRLKLPEQVTAGLETQLGLASDGLDCDPYDPMRYNLDLFYLDAASFSQVIPVSCYSSPFRAILATAMMHIPPLQDCDCVQDP